MRRKLRPKVKTRPMCYPEFDTYLDRVSASLFEGEDLAELEERSYREALAEEAREEPWSVETKREKGRKKPK